MYGIKIGCVDGTLITDGTVGPSGLRTIPASQSFTSLAPLFGTEIS